MNLVKLQRLVLPFVVEGVLRANRDSRSRFVEKLESIEFVTTRMESVGRGGFEVELRLLYDEDLFRYLAGEANNFFLASRITYDRALQEQFNNAAWQVVEHYYAAFYAAHYLLRTAGVSLTAVDELALKAIKKSFVGRPNSAANVTTGLYVLRYNSLNASVLLTKVEKAGGSHRELWQLWLEFLDKMRSEAAQDASEYLSESLGLLEHRDFLCRSTGYFRPPEIRGEINYQFKGGAWAFELKSSDSIRRLKSIVAQQSSEIGNFTAPSEKLVACGALAIQLAHQVFIHAAKSYPKSICRSLANKHKAFL